MKMRPMPTARSVLAGAVLMMLSGCPALQAALENYAKIDPPKVTLQGISLADTPTQRSLSAYFCPKLLRERAGLSIGADLLCSQFFGPAPAMDALKLGFDVRLGVQNPNKVPLPLSSILSAITVFPGQQQGELGAACVSLCSPEDPECGQRDQNACPTGATDVTNAADVQAAFGKLLLGEGARLATGEGLGVKPPKVIAESALDVVVRFSLAPERLVPVLEQFARQSVGELQAGRMPSFAIPYQMRGNVFTGPLGSAGQLSAPFGPIDGLFETPR